MVTWTWHSLLLAEIDAEIKGAAVKPGFVEQQLDGLLLGAGLVH